MICPIFIVGSNNFGSEFIGKVVSECIGKDCMWWLPFAKDCAVPAIAGILADSTICQNIWDEPEKDGGDNG